MEDKEKEIKCEEHKENCDKKHCKEKCEKDNCHKKHNKEVEKLKKENLELNEKVLRISAEMQNMKRRYEEEISRIYRYEGESFIKKTLSVLDNFERAISMDDTNLEDEVSKFLSGFKLIYGELKKNLSDIGVEEIKCLNNPFNPEAMEAVLTEKVEGVESGLVIDVMLKGYKYNDKIIRPAMVKVSE